MKWIFLFLGFGLFVSCVKESAVTDDYELSAKNRIVFEVRHFNYAKMFIFDGFFVDDGGRVVTYDASEKGPDAFLDDADDSGAFRAALGSNNEVLATIDMGELEKKIALIDVAAKGDYSEKINRCFDYGTTQFRAYVFDENSNSYRSLLLLQAGDWAYKNMSPEAAELAEWLMTLNPRFAGPKCMP